MSANRIRFSSSPSDAELLRDWTLTPADKREIRTCRGSGQRYSFALQLCILRQRGHFMSADQNVVPLRILNHLGEQLGLQPTLFLPPPEREQTQHEHHQRIRKHLDFSTFGRTDRTALVRWLRKQLKHDLHSGELLALAQEFLRLRRTTVPAESTLRRIVGVEVAKEEGVSFSQIAALIDERIRVQIDNMLVVETGHRASTLAWLAQYPPAATPTTILDYLERLRILDETGVQSVDVRDLRPSLLNYCARLCDKYNAGKLKRFPAEKRYALVFSLLVKTQRTLLDHVVEMHRTFLIGMNRRAHKAKTAKERELHLRAQEGIAIMLGAIDVIIDKDIPMTERAGTAHDKFGTEVLETAAEDYRKLATAGEDVYLESIRARHTQLKQYLPGFLRLPFEAEPGMEDLLDAIAMARRLHNGEIARLPGDAPVAFTSVRWRTAILAKPPIDQQLWEIAVGFAVRDGLRSGDLYLANSQRHISFWNLIYSPEQWKTERQGAYQQLRITQDCSTGIAKLIAEHHAEATALADGLEDNPFIDFHNRQVAFRRREALVTPTSVNGLRQVLHARVPRVRIEELLLAVDKWCGFTKELVPPEGYTPRGPKSYQTLLAALVAHGTNLGITTMAQSTKGMTVSTLHDTTRLCLRPETFKAANRVLVDYHHRLPMSNCWGAGETSSSDGQRFGVQGNSLIGSYYPRYFGHYDKALSVYTHLSDQYSVFSTRIISCGPREALYVLDGLIENDTVLGPREHYTDSHGATEQLFGLCHLLGYSFRPRLKDLKSQKLYRISREHNYGQVDHLFSGTLDLEPLRSQWDQLVRLAASLANRTASAHVVLEKLIASSRTFLDE